MDIWHTQLKSKGKSCNYCFVSSGFVEREHNGKHLTDYMVETKGDVKILDSSSKKIAHTKHLR